MAKGDTTNEPSQKALADLSALADGTLDPARAAAVREQIARSPQLSERYELERQAVSALRATRSDFAPPRLRARIEAERRRATATRPRLVFGGALATAVAAVVVALVLLLPGGAPGSPSISQAAALALRGPAQAPPAIDSKNPIAKLDQGVQEIYFPNWVQRGWIAAGQRTDQLGGKNAVTVYYDHGRTRIAYTILSAPALKWARAHTWVLAGTTLQSFRLDGRTVVTWRRAGHTCVLSGPGVSERALSQLAAWKVPGLGG
jgi:anti-sigma factor RsiW